nr:uncharacterized protein LOC105324311 isoform X1 [Crassostrea gigas]
MVISKTLSINCDAGSNKIVEVQTGVIGIEEKNDNRVEHEKGTFFASIWRNILVFLLCISFAKGADLRDRHPREQGMSMNFCEIYTSPVSKSSGPWNGSMCSTKLKQIQCPKGKKKGCMPLVFGDWFFAACIKKFEDLKDDQCILITQIRGSNQKVAQCYEGKEYCLLPVFTSPPISSKSTRPLTSNATNASSNKSTGTDNWTTVLAFLLCYWFIA